MIFNSRKTVTWKLNKNKEKTVDFCLSFGYNEYINIFKKKESNMQYLILFLEGIVTFVSPCLLPLLPVYISFFAGGDDVASKKTLRNAIAFVLGFTCMFVIMGALAGIVGAFLSKYRTVVNVVTGMLVVLFGLNFLGVFNIPFFHRAHGTVDQKNTGLIPAFVFGIIFSLGWTPCVGAFLGSALMMASREGSMLNGIVMLLMYSLGLGIPFILSAVLIDKLKNTFDFIKRNYKIVNRISGGILVVVGILMATGLFDRFISLID